MINNDRKHLNNLSDKEIIEAILRRDYQITKWYFYDKCYPLFSSIYNNYYTNCDNCIDFITDIYVYLLSTSEKTKTCKLESFKYGCTLTMWLKIVTLNYCCQLFKKKIDFVNSSENKIEISDSLITEGLNTYDDEVILRQISKEKYRDLIRYRYLEDMTNEETAKMLEIPMQNYYKMHYNARKELEKIMGKEGIL